MEKFEKYKLKRIPPLMHPEQEDDEVFISNETKKTAEQIKWKSKRLGKKAYDMIPMLLEKKLIPVKGMFPLFVKRSEMDAYREKKFIKEEKKK